MSIIKPFNWQKTEICKHKALKYMIDKNDTYCTFKMKQIYKNFSCKNLTN